jgi:hypothetical protein
VTNLWSLDLFLDGKKVYGFFKPPLVENYIYAGASNPNTNQLAQVGEALSVYYFNTITMQKVKLTNVPIQSDTAWGFF